MHKSDSKFPWTALLAGLAPVLLASPTALQAQPLQGRLVQMQGTGKGRLDRFGVDKGVPAFCSCLVHEAQKFAFAAGDRRSL